MNNKNNQPCITLIMPVFNAADYLDQSIQSLMKQDCSMWKLVCVDDGSTDASQSIIEEYAKKDDRITLVVQQNSGPAVARARAISMAATEYVAIIDADDMVQSDYIRKMLSTAYATHADIIMPNVKIIDGNGNIIDISSHFERNSLSADTVIEDSEKAFDMSVTWILHGWVMMKTRLAKTYYTEKEVCYSRFNSDEYVTRLLYLNATGVALCEAVYLYRNNADSLTHKLAEHHFDRLLTYEHLVALCAKYAIGGGFFARFTKGTEAA